MAIAKTSSSKLSDHRKGHVAIGNTHTHTHCIVQILFNEVEVNNGDIKIIKYQIKSYNDTNQGGDNTDEKNCKTQNLC